MRYLLKTEPEEFSFTDLRKLKRTEWDGVTNPVAVKHLREMKPGDDLIIYHTGKEKRAVGTARVVSVDPANPKSPVVFIEARAELSEPVALAEMKAEKAFHDSPLLRQGRLSVVPLTDAQYRFLLRN